jgi:hypothetical protein
MKNIIEWIKQKTNNLNFDFEKIKTMNPTEFNEYVKEIYISELIRLWTSISYSMNYMYLNNSWQYILVLYMNK